MIPNKPFFFSGEITGRLFDLGQKEMMKVERDRGLDVDVRRCTCRCRYRQVI